MSHHALQRALVVALHDRAFVDAMHADPDAALARFRLEPAERAQLLAVDPRAFAVDRLRPRRVLKAIVEELRASMAIALAETHTFATADAFFSSPAFHDAVLHEQPLVLALADYLAGAGLTSPQLPGVLAIERACAESRRDAARQPGPGLSLAPGIRLLATTSGALAALQAAEQHLFELSLLPHMALCDDRPPLALPPPGGDPLHLAIRSGELSDFPEPLFRALHAIENAATRAPVRRGDMAAILAAVGLRVPDPAQLAANLLADGYLTEE
jgi:hypothetical protein